MEWQPIETAPRDGTRILVFYPVLDGHIFTAGFEFGTWQSGIWDGRREQPTHWMPLPEPPEN